VEIRNTYSIVIGKSKEKKERPLGKPRRRGKGHVQFNFIYEDYKRYI
jgi:hypothetical protein